MSRRRETSWAASARAQAPVFAALGDGTRLQLIRTLCLGEPRSIAELTAESRLTRQAITKHLRVLENVGLVLSERRGRETRFHFAPDRLDAAKRYLDEVAAQWDQALARLKAFVESDGQ